VLSTLVKVPFLQSYGLLLPHTPLSGSFLPTSQLLLLLGFFSHVHVHVYLFDHSVTADAVDPKLHRFDVGALVYDFGFDVVLAALPHFIIFAVHVAVLSHLLHVHS
jgi:hypothetical protein